MPSPNAATKAWGMLNKRERWGLSWKGRFILLLTVVLAGILVVLNIHSFLAVTERENTKILVVEGWINQFTAHVVAGDFKTNSYEHIFTTGGPISGSGGYINDYNTSASIGAGLLRNAGIPPEFVQMVPSRVSGRDRTYNSALALRNWFQEHNMQVRSINVVTEDAHARRTRLLFQKALGNHVTVGIISVPNPDYDAKHWWRYSEGVREVLGESIAYLYARVFFHPASPDQAASVK